jgi:hypothetical protein
MDESWPVQDALAQNCPANCAFLCDFGLDRFNRDGILRLVTIVRLATTVQGKRR